MALNCLLKAIIYRTADAGDSLDDLSKIERQMENLPYPYLLSVLVMVKEALSHLLFVKRINTIAELSAELTKVGIENRFKLVVKSSVNETNSDLSKIEKSLRKTQAQIQEIKQNAKVMRQKRSVKKGKKI